MGETRNQGKKGPKRRFILKLRSKKKGCRPSIMIGHKTPTERKKNQLAPASESESFPFSQPKLSRCVVFGCEMKKVEIV